MITNVVLMSFLTIQFTEHLKMLHLHILLLNLIMENLISAGYLKIVIYLYVMKK